MDEFVGGVATLVGTLPLPTAIKSLRPGLLSKL
jgi:hypothetical protein